MQLTPSFKLSSGEYTLMQFPSGELQVTVKGFSNLNSNYNVRITGSILSSDNIITTKSVPQVHTCNELVLL